MGDTDLADLAADYRQRADAWRQTLRPGTGLDSATNRACGKIADLEALACLVAGADALTRIVGGNPQHAVRAARRLASLIEARTSATCCPTCTGPIRETVDMVCQTCGTDYGPPTAASSTAGLAAIESRAEVAREHVAKLCSGVERWTMRVPAQPGRDSDLVIDAALQDVPALVARVRQLEAREQDMRREAAILRWAADRLDSLGTSTVNGSWLRRWADEFAAGTHTVPTTDTTEEQS